jgi:hypothetical protein
LEPGGHGQTFFFKQGRQIFSEKLLQFLFLLSKVYVSSCEISTYSVLYLHATSTCIFCHFFFFRNFSTLLLIFVENFILYQLQFLLFPFIFHIPNLNHSIPLLFCSVFSNFVFIYQYDTKHLSSFLSLASVYLQTVAVEGYCCI